MNCFSKIFKIVSIYVMVLALAACQAPAPVVQPQPVQTQTSQPQVTQPQATQPPAAPTQTAPQPLPSATTLEKPPLYLDATASTPARVEDLLSRMTLEEKIGQMTQVDKGSILPADITKMYIGSLLSGGGGSPASNTAEDWAKMVDGFQKSALKTRLAIPLIYGVDAVHGHNNLYGATIFPHNIGLGSANDPKLMEQIGQATAEEMAATGIRWNFAPVVAVVQDIRWGRTYEGYSENTALVTSLGSAYVRGLQNAAPGGLSQPPSVLATPKHFIGDGGTKWGTARMGAYALDQGDVQMDEAALRKLFLPSYQAAMDAGAQSIMVSFSSWNGTKMHGQKHLLTDVLKGELGFKGFLISDWQAINQLPGDYYSDVITSINAGLDMIMVPNDYKTFIYTLTQAVNKGDVPRARIDDATRRILTVKFNLGLFEKPYSDPSLLATVGSDAHRSLARQAVAKSLVLLKNDNQTLPLSKEAGLVFVGGSGAKDIGMQCGGWTISWQGRSGSITPGTTILDAVKAATGGKSKVVYDSQGEYKDETAKAEVGIAVVGELPYAEGVGDRADLALSANDQALIQKMRARSQKLIVIILSGRPLIITDQLPLADAWVAAWLPGTEAEGITDALFGDVKFSGKLSYTWPRSKDQLPQTEISAGQQPLFSFGFGLGD
jgi:beta-glucosidase